MRFGRGFFIVLLAVVMLLTAGESTAQSTSHISGYVSYGYVPVNGATVTLAGPASGQATTADNAGNAGYYEFYVAPGNYVVTATYNGHSASRAYSVSYSEVRIDLDISTATPTPTPGPSPTPTPRPSHEPGGPVVRNESSSFIPMPYDYTVTPVPKPSPRPTSTPTAVPTATPTPTPVPSFLSSIYVWLVIALIAIIAIAAAALILLRR